VIGQGSIGRRHAGILLELGHQVVVYDPATPTPLADGVLSDESLEAALEGADAAVIASPSSEHAGQARRALERSVPVLVEKPLATDVARAGELDCLARERGVLLAVAMNLRHHAGVSALADLLHDDAVGRVLRASAWCGSWLPGWRPGADYRTAYSARAELGGGVLLDVAVHELDYVLWLLGPAVSVTALARRVSDLELDVEDVASIALELRSGAVAEITVDYFDRSYHRGCRLVGERATAHWSWEGESLTLLGPDGPSSERSVASDVGPAYRRQLERFTAAARGDAGMTAPAGDARHVLAVVEAARVSAREGRRVVLAPPITLRAVERRDSARLRAWRNDPDTRRWSRAEAEVSLSEHECWLDQVLADSANALWIAEAEGAAIGQIRVTRDADGSAELHVTIAPEARGRGLGAALLVEACGRELADPSVQRLVAHVKVDNHSSRCAFARAGFEPVGHDDAGLLRLERRPCR
jgi:predicted dehydrogenase/RimJ/RimL family protein N-acetyltransferase